MTPKSLLRHELSVSALERAHARQFPERDRRGRRPAGAGGRRVVFCSGKVYFDLLKARAPPSSRDVALVRIEQLYPFPHRNTSGAAPLSARARDRLVPGRAAEPGRLVPDPSSLQEPLEGDARAALFGPRAGGCAGHGHHARSTREQHRPRRRPR
jgi:hypothetical protein